MNIKTLAVLGCFAIALPAAAGSWQAWGPNGGDTRWVVAHPRHAGEAFAVRIDGSANVDRRVQTFGTHDFGGTWPDRGQFDIRDLSNAPISLGFGGTYRYLAADGRLFRSQDGGIAVKLRTAHNS